MIGVTDEGEIAKSIAQAITEEEFILIDSPKKVYSEKPDIVIHTLESNYDNRTMWNYNTWFAINIARAANKIGALNVYFSTYMIFDGKKGYYSETSTPSPLNYYGLSKLVGETGIASLGNYLILRLGQLTNYGIFNYFIKTLIKKGVIKCNTNLYLSPLSLRDLGYVVRSLIKKDARGIINVGGKRQSEYEICLKLAEMFDGLALPFEGKFYDFSLDIWLLKTFGIKID
ncbi:sugar nucleotide-binding protein [Acidianus sulfidivorans JP7]|uniref:dTDP-4-dehydrorhamnose reductase n=1 Tax=Acidianus sulfidivorans JP7 TaxID=619593 RepID=A0A2U9IQT1_9CREN|nr:sugar nucleotide-binding protein [Acidianus sulfidivorans]AWR98334.1 sugar nucleotide-binding protein [Acidianus sulfidivorans JP7]